MLSVVDRAQQSGAQQLGQLARIHPVILAALLQPLCANIGETSCPSTITVGRGKKSHLDEHKQDKYFFRCVGSFGA
jgi:hypothetical protein